MLLRDGRMTAAKRPSSCLARTGAGGRASLRDRLRLVTSLVRGHHQIMVIRETAGHGPALTARMLAWYRQGRRSECAASGMVSRVDTKAGL